MRTFDPRLVGAAPAARTAVLRLGAIGVVQGIATVATAFALTALVMAAVRGAGGSGLDGLVGPSVAVVALLAKCSGRPSTVSVSTSARRSPGGSTSSPRSWSQITIDPSLA